MQPYMALSKPRRRLRCESPLDSYPACHCPEAETRTGINANDRGDRTLVLRFSHQDEASRTKAWLGLIKGRRSPPRCLSCRRKSRHSFAFHDPRRDASCEAGPGHDWAGRRACLDRMRRVPGWDGRVNATQLQLQQEMHGASRRGHIKLVMHACTKAQVTWTTERQPHRMSLATV